jgi:hypothetical protein
MAPKKEDPLYLAALAAEKDEVLNPEMADWESCTLQDGLSTIDCSAAQASGGFLLPSVNK